jgi:exodeoxyribonuclease-1
MAIKPTYLFYDLETSGLNPCFDQVMQFAAIRTDLDLNEIERYEWLVQLKPENIANPYAIITHGLSPKQCEPGKTEYRSIQDIHALLNQPGTLSGGYNTLGFDDTFLRFSFYRHLLTPYTHQFKNDCGRFDLYPITILYYLYSDININWPTNNGKISMKLENLNAANHLAEGKAHEAMCDVEATLALAKLFKQEPERFNYAMGFFDKKTDTQRVNQITTKLTIAIEGKIGARNQFQSLVASLGQHQHYNNQSCWLCLDTIDFSATDPSELIEKSLCIKKRAGEAPLLLPALERFLKKTSSEKIALAEKNIDWLEANPKLAESLKQHYQTATYPEVTTADCYAKLYQMGFPNYHDNHLMQSFHKAANEEKAELATQFENKTYNLLAERLLETVSASYQDYIDQRFGIAPDPAIDYQGQPALTKKQAIQLCDDILNAPEKFSEQQRTLCEEYLNYLTTLATPSLCTEA